MALSVMTSNKDFTKVYANMLIITYTLYMHYQVIPICFCDYITITVHQVYRIYYMLISMHTQL